MTLPNNNDRIAAPNLPKLHDRDYHVESYRQGEDRMLLRGEVHDQKPPGVYFENDTEPLTVHHMVVDLVVEFPTMLIVEAKVVLETHPHSQCVSIEDHYDKLAGLSIARGFTHKVRELFGGPRGCTHTTALLQAMAPVAVQSVWSMRSIASNVQTVDAPTRKPTPAENRERMSFNLNTCHVWAEDGPMFATLDAGEDLEPPLWAVDRMEALGLDYEAWSARMRG
jgi:hypothetical protein